MKIGQKSVKMRFLAIPQYLLLNVFPKQEFCTSCWSYLTNPLNYPTSCKNFGTIRLPVWAAQESKVGRSSGNNWFWVPLRFGYPCCYASSKQVEKFMLLANKCNYFLAKVHTTLGWAKMLGGLRGSQATSLRCASNITVHTAPPIREIIGTCTTFYYFCVKSHILEPRIWRNWV